MSERGRTSARIVPERPHATIGAARLTKQRLASLQAESASVSGADVKPAKKVPPLGTLRSKRFIQDSASSLVTRVKLTPCQARVRKLQQRILAFMDTKPVSIMLSLITVYALFGDDTRSSVAPASADYVFFNISFVVMTIYAVELLLNCFAKPNYMGSFYFWLDLVSTASLIVDVGWIWQALVGSSTNTSGSALRAGRASRAGARAGRIVRIVRLIRLIRVMKFFTQVEQVTRQQDKSKSALKRTRRSVSISPTRRDSNISLDEPSQVGKQLSDLTTRRVIFLVLIMVVVLPFLEQSTTTSLLTPEEYGLKPLHQVGCTYPLSQTFNDTLLYYASRDLHLLYIQLYNVSDYAIDEVLQQTPYPYKGAIDGYRDYELITSVDTSCYDLNGHVVTNVNLSCNSFAYFDNRAYMQRDGLMNILKTIFVIVVLAIGSVLFTTDSETLVIRPIERMVGMLMALADDPLRDMTTIASMEEAPVKRGPVKRFVAKLGCAGHATTSLNYETDLIEKTITKIAGLLQVGFGEAGARIIAQNIKGSKKGKLDPMVEGRKMKGIFGFCDIRQFTDATECLQEEVMVFVNRIADIVHNATVKYAGAANKNIGDAFLLVWSLSESDIKDHHKSGFSESEVESEQILESQLADNALYAFMKIVVDIENSNLNGVLAEYGVNPKLSTRFPSGFKVRMGFGLHQGWAIEGTIGSKFKIDASYLSPNVNMASRLEAATKQYGVNILISGPFYAQLSLEAKSVCRMVDRVTVKGSAVPVELYTVDFYSLPESFGYASVEDQYEFLDAEFGSDHFVALTQEKEPEGFREVFQRGLEAYLAGDWEAAKDEFEVALHARDGDGPSNTLLSFMKEYNYVCPEGWPGYRELTEK